MPPSAFGISPSAFAVGAPRKKVAKKKIDWCGLLPIERAALVRVDLVEYRPQLVAPRARHLYSYGLKQLWPEVVMAHGVKANIVRADLVEYRPQLVAPHARHLYIYGLYSYGLY